MAGASEPQAILTPAGERLAEHPPGLGEDLGRLLLEDRVDAVDRHVVGQRSRADEERPGLGHELDRVVGGQRSVLDAVDPGADAGADPGVAVRVRGHPQAVAMGLVDDGRQLLVGVLLAAGGAARTTSRRPTPRS